EGLVSPGILPVRYVRPRSLSPSFTKWAEGASMYMLRQEPDLVPYTLVELGRVAGVATNLGRPGETVIYREREGDPTADEEEREREREEERERVRDYNHCITVSDEPCPRPATVDLDIRLFTHTPSDGEGEREEERVLVPIEFKADRDTLSLDGIRLNHGMALPILDAGLPGLMEGERCLLYGGMESVLPKAGTVPALRHLYPLLHTLLSAKDRLCTFIVLDVTLYRWTHIEHDYPSTASISRHPSPRPIKRDHFCVFGDPTGTGTGGECIMGLIKGRSARYLPDHILLSKGLPIKHDRAGIVGLLPSINKPNTLGSQIYVTLGPAPMLDDRGSIIGESPLSLSLSLCIPSPLCLSPQAMGMGDSAQKRGRGVDGGEVTQDPKRRPGEERGGTTGVVVDGQPGDTDPTPTLPIPTYSLPNGARLGAADEKVFI
ncbi:LOW QUALITY PROTEIN: hypothetical protein KIPB_004849, partial [Kipferlia bialata]